MSDDVLNQAAASAYATFCDADEDHYNGVTWSNQWENTRRTWRLIAMAARSAAPAPAVDREALIEFLTNVDDGEITETEMSEAFWSIEGVYDRAGGSRPGSTFEGQMLTAVQARWARTHLIAAFAAALLSAGYVRTGPTPDREALEAAIAEAFNTAHEPTPDEYSTLEESHRHDGHQYYYACWLCRNDVDKLAPHLVDAILPLLAPGGTDSVGGER
jgi:hypothetical protein